MRAALIKSLDGPAAIVIEDVAAPVAAAGEVIVRVEVAALNFMDTLISRGGYQVKPPLPFSPAAEIAGTVAALGPGVTGVDIGARVQAFVGWGGARELVAVPVARLVPVPDAVSSRVAAGVSVTYGTAMHGLAARGRLLAGETVVVLGASGGAGLAAVEIAHLMGARVIAVASAGKLEVCRQHGASVLVESASPDMKAALQDASHPSSGPAVIYDCVGGATGEQALRALAAGGRYLVVGFASGTIPSIPLNRVLLKGCDILGVNWPAAVAADPTAHTAQMQQVLGWVETGLLAPRVHAAYPLAEIAEAIAVLDDRRAIGKVVIDMTA